MSKEKKCSSCGGKLQKIGTVGLIRHSRCVSCGKESTTKIKKSSLDSFISSEEINTLRNCVSCNARYAAVSDPDLCPDCHASFLGKTAADDHTEVEMSAPVNCDFCHELGTHVQASYDGRTKWGPWAYMCEDHFKQHGMGLGLGNGQRLKFQAKEKAQEIVKPGEKPVPDDIPLREPQRVPLVPTREVPAEPAQPTPAEPAEPAQPTTPEEPAQPTPEEPTVPDYPPDVFPDFPPPEWFEPDKTPETVPPVKEPEKVPVGKNKGDKMKVVNASDNAYPNEELTGLIDQQRVDTSRWQDSQNHSPNPNVNPAELHGTSDVPPVDRTSETSVNSATDREGGEVVAKVFTGSEDIIEGAKVLLSDGEFQVVGKVVTDAEDGFAVEWRTGRKSIEKKANYELVIVKNAQADSFEDCFYTVGSTHHCTNCDFTTNDTEEARKHMTTHDSNR